MMEPSHKTSYTGAPGRWVLFVLAWICVVLGIVGIILPLMPGTVFLILAAWLFSRSSPRFEAWLVSHSRLGPAVLAWRETGAVPWWVPYIASGSLAVSFVVLVVLQSSLIMLVLLGALFIGISAYLWMRPVI